MGEATAGTLTVAAAPIGCPADASPRLAAALASAAVVAAEDTRKARRLAADLGVRISGPVISCYEAVERQRAQTLLAKLRAGDDVLLLTDAGMPGVSDPGYRLVSAAATAGIRISPLPGPSAVTAALAVAGLPSDRFCFEGFPPRRAGARARRLAELAAEPRTMVFFEASRRLGATLAEMAEAFGADRHAVVCRELTKTHEEIRRGTLGEHAEWAAAGVRGEVTVVVAGAPEAGGGARARRIAGAAASDGPGGGRTDGGGADLGRAIDEVARRAAGGMSRSEAIAAVAADHGLPRRRLYNAVMARRRVPQA